MLTSVAAVAVVADATPDRTAQGPAALTTAGDVAAQDGPGNDTDAAKPDPALSAQVLQLADAAATGDGGSELITHSNGETRITVRVEAVPGRADAAAQAVAANGGSVTARHENLLLVDLPPNAVSALADTAAIDFVTVPRQPDPSAVTSQGLDNMHVPEVHGAGVTGENVTVAVIDVGFNVSNPEIEANVGGFGDFEGDGMDNTSGLHGTAAAELVVDTAPNATVLLFEIGTEVHMLNAIDHVDENTTADVVSVSLGWHHGPFDGTSTMDREIDDSIANGTQWFVSAGNQANGLHLNTTWNDPNGNGFHNFSAADESLNINPAGEVTVVVNWDDFPDSTNDYDVYLVDANGNTVDLSNNVQDGSQPPIEVVSNRSPIGPLRLYIENVTADGTGDFDIFVDGGTLEYATAPRSIARPATGVNVVTVGATDAWDDSLEAFSSQGPTIDGRLKPDVVAPDNVTTTAIDPFVGTSAAAPHAAGVGALLLDAKGSLSPADLKGLLHATARPVLGTEPNTLTGAGLIDARTAVHHALTVSVSGRIDEADSTPAANDLLRWAGVDTADHVDNVTNDAGEFAVRLEENRTYDVRYYQDDPRTDADVAFPKDGSVDVLAADRVSYDAPVTGLNGTLPDGHNLTVTVVNDSGVPVENATVHVASHTDVPDDDEAVHAAVTAETDAAGDLVHPGSDGPGFEVNGTVHVEVEPTGTWLANGTTVELDADRHLTLTVNPAVNVSGQLAEADGSPAAADAIEWRGRDVNHGAHNVTAGQGAFAARLVENGTYGLVYRQDDPRSSADVAFPKDGSVDVYTPGTVRYAADTNVARTLPEGHNLTVAVVNASGDPVENATVHVLAIGTVSGGEDVRAHVAAGTDATGALVHPESDGPGFEVNGTVGVFVEGPGDAYFDNGTELDVSADRHLVLTLRPKVDVAGQLAEADGSPAAADSLEWRGRDVHHGDHNVTSGGGAFAAELIENATYGVVYRQDDPRTNADVAYPKDGTVDLYTPGTVRHTADATLAHTLPAGHNLTVTVVNASGDPVGNAPVHVAHARPVSGDDEPVRAHVEVRTDAAGDVVHPESDGPGFELNGTAEVFVEGSAIGYFDNGTTVNVSADRHVTIVLEPAVTVAGRFLEPDGTGAPTDFVVARNPGTFRTNGTDAGGNYSIAIPRDEPVSLAFAQLDEAAGSLLVRDGVVDLYEFAEVNRSADGDLGTTTLPAGHVLNVTVVNESGVPVPAAIVGVVHHGAPAVRAAVIEFPTNADGMFQGDNVPPGIEVSGDVSVGVRPPENATAFKDQLVVRNLTVTGDTNVTVTLDEVDTTPPTVTNASAVDAGDGDLNVTDGDVVTVTADIADDEGVRSAVVNASDLGGGFVALADDDGDGTFTATVHVDAANASADGDYRLWVGANDSADNIATATTNPLTLDTAAPTITNALATDRTDGDGNVSDGDTIGLSATVSDGSTGVDTVAADASAFGAGVVRLVDDDGDGTYNGTFTVNESGAAGEGLHNVTIGANDTAGNVALADTNDLRFRRVTRISANAPGFTMGVAFLALLAVALVGARRRRG